MNILALDVSLRHTGYAYSVAGEPIQSGTFEAPKAGKLDGLPLFRWVSGAILGLAGRALVGRPGPRLVLLEGFSFGSKGRAVYDIGMLGGILRYRLDEAGFSYLEVSPKTLKKYATGSGNSGKSAVLQAGWKRLGFEGADDNECDALWLLQLALAHFHLPGAVTVPLSHAVALDAIRWPELPPAGEPESAPRSKLKRSL